MKKLALVMIFLGLGTVMGASAAVAQSTLAQKPAESATFVPLAPIPGLTSNAGMVANSAGTSAFLNKLYIYMIGVAAVLAVVEIIWGGLEIATKDSVSSKSDGKKRIWQALMGLALVLSPALVFGIINPAILNMSIGMDALNVQQYAGYVAPSNIPTPPSSTPGWSQTCTAQSGGVGACSAAMVSACKNTQGGTAQTTTQGTGTVNVQTTVTCSVSAPTAPDGTVDSAGCAGLAPGISPYSSLSKTPPKSYSASEGQTCASAGAFLNKSNSNVTGLTQCTNVAGGGYCLHG